ncbi:MAG: DUF4417 domain-containing protein [Thermotaleaceae bacterium]
MACTRDCKECFLYKDCGGCSLCERSLCQEKCHNCFSLCFHRPKAAAYIKSLGGIEINAAKNGEITLPKHIPILPDRLRAQPALSEMPLVGVHGGNMFARNGEKINKSYLEKGFAGALNLHENTRGVLEFYVKDRTLEGLWDKRKEIYPKLREMNFTAVIAPNFSVYEDTPRLDHLYNMKRSVTTYNEMMEAGICAVPDISWYGFEDLRRWAEAINRENIKTISVSFQVVDVRLKASGVWKSYLLGFRYLCQNIPSDVQIIIAGLVSKEKVGSLYKACGSRKLHILNQSAYVQSRRGILSETRKANPQMDFDTLFRENISYFNRIYREEEEYAQIQSQKYYC